MSLATTYNPLDVEAKWYQRWQEMGFFRASPNPDKQPYTIVIPPPNVTGVLHMGHMLNNTIQDVLVRRARMQGREACWVPGTDHASIATETKVVALLKEQGINKKDLTREQFLAHAFAWKEKYGGIILEQLKQLGASCDWDRTRFTMEPDLTDAVLRAFVDLHAKGLIYRGVRMVNWDPQGGTALSDEEVIAKNVTGKMFHLKYELVAAPTNEQDTDEPETRNKKQETRNITVATSRPETIMADVAVAVNPADPRYQHLIGQLVRIPLVGREIPVIADARVAVDFGTGTLKVTPAHDLVDYEIGQANNLPVIDILNDDGTLNGLAGPRYAGLDRFAVRRLIAKDLDEAGLLVKVEEYATISQTSERTGAVIEPKLSLQWFLKTETLAAPALEAVENGTVQLHPAKFKNLYRVWMENPRDWCISRQLWWGQQIPAYYLPDGGVVVARTAAEALALAQARPGGEALQASDLRQDEDVLDTWFSSWLWPISVFDGFKDPDNADIKYFYPTNDLVTGPDILFFWIARMIMAGLEFRGEVPFRNVYLTGIVRDAQGRKMSKQLGNSPDPLELIQQYGADGVRTGMLFSAPAGNDLLFDLKLVEQGRNFSNKVWNAFRLVQGWETDAALPFGNALAVSWFEARLAAAAAEMDDHFGKFRISDALLTVYKLVWDDFCALYLEMVKPAYQQPIDPQTLRHTVGFFETLLRLLHPFMPFITEELWHALAPRTGRDYVCVAPWPALAPAPDASARQSGMDWALGLVAGVRTVRNQKQVPPTKALALRAKGAPADLLAAYGPLLRKLANLTDIEATDAAPAAAVGFVHAGAEYFVPLEGQIDAAAERARLEKELDYTLGFKESVERKLGNEKFAANAKPDVLERERQKLADAVARIAALEAALRAL